VDLGHVADVPEHTAGAVHIPSGRQTTEESANVHWLVQQSLLSGEHCPTILKGRAQRFVIRRIGTLSTVNSSCMCMANQTWRRGLKVFKNSRSYMSLCLPYLHSVVQQLSGPQLAPQSHSSSFSRRPLPQTASGYAARDNIAYIEIPLQHASFGQLWVRGVF
jgi:hypothetical protein